MHDDNTFLMDIEDKSINVHPTISKEHDTYLDIYVDLLIELEHSANHVYDDGLEKALIMYLIFVRILHIMLKLCPLHKRNNQRRPWKFNMSL